MLGEQLVYSTVVDVDNTDVDNELAAIAACHPLLNLNVQAVIVSGRPAYPNATKHTPITAVDREYSEKIHILNTRRMRGVLSRHGYGHIPVYKGLIAPRTVVPPYKHIDEHNMDFEEDNRRQRENGDYQAAVKKLAKLGRPIHIISGGPLTQVARLMTEPRLRGKFGYLACQMGAFGFHKVTTMSGKEGVSFNAGCDPAALQKVLLEFPGKGCFLVPSDVTKNHKVGVDYPSDLLQYGISAEIVGKYQFFWEKALKNSNERIYPHDVHPVLLLWQLIQGPRLYGMEEVVFSTVDELGRITAQRHVSRPSGARHILITETSADMFWQSLRAIFAR